MKVYYNEIDRYCCAWLRRLMDAGLIPAGDVDERSIEDVQPDELLGYTQCHFFAGLGGWAYALRLAGWPNEWPVWTGSCPCQPFSAAGSRKGKSDKRHLWPEFRRLIGVGNPPVCFGEQVASALGREWLAGVRIDLEEMGYAVGGADLGAASVGAPHIRQRLYWVADTDDGGFPDVRKSQLLDEQGSPGYIANRCSPPGRLGLTLPAGLSLSEREDLRGEGRREEGRAVEQSGGSRSDGVAYPESPRSWTGLRDCESGEQRRNEPGDGGGTRWMGNTTSGGCRIVGDAPFARRGGYPIGAEWAGFDVILCRDGKARRIESGSFPLAYGIPGRVGQLRAYGNAIVPQVVEQFIRAYMEATA